MITEIIATEVTREEMCRILEERKTAAKNAAIEAKADEICKLLQELQALGGHVTASRKGKNCYLSRGSNGLYNAKAS